MSNYKYQVDFSTKFKKSLKKVTKQGKDIDKLDNIILKLANKEPLEEKYKDHQLINNKTYRDCRECHIEPDWLLVYKYIDNNLVLLLVATGSHSDVLNK